MNYDFLNDRCREAECIVNPWLAKIVTVNDSRIIDIKYEILEQKILQCILCTCG